jgi:hypothetical protein
VQIEFSAVGNDFTREPFLVTFDTDKDSIITKPFGAVAATCYVGPPMPSGWTVESTPPSVDNGDLAILTHSGLRVDMPRSG